MHDTVELLEAIGRDASLRHASPEALASALDAAGASPGVRELAATGNDAALTAELGLVKLHGEHMSQTGGHEGDGDDHDPAHHPDHDDEGDEDGTASDDDLDAPSP